MAQLKDTIIDGALSVTDKTVLDIPLNIESGGTGASNTTDIKKNLDYSMITAYIDADITKTTTGESVAQLSSYHSKGTGFSLQDGAIIIGSGIDCVEISANAMIRCASSVNAAAKNLYINQNSSNVAMSMNSSWSATGVNFTLNVSPKILFVTEGDKITLGWYATVGDYLNYNHARTYITVKEI